MDCPLKDQGAVCRISIGISDIGNGRQQVQENCSTCGSGCAHTRDVPLSLPAPPAGEVEDET